MELTVLYHIQICKIYKPVSVKALYFLLLFFHLFFFLFFSLQNPQLFFLLLWKYVILLIYIFLFFSRLFVGSKLRTTQSFYFFIIAFWALFSTLFWKLFAFFKTCMPLKCYALKLQYIIFQLVTFVLSWKVRKV